MKRKTHHASKLGAEIQDPGIVTAREPKPWPPSLDITRAMEPLSDPSRVHPDASITRRIAFSV